MSKPRVTRHEVVQPQDESIRLIPLTKGQDAIVDAADFEWLSQWNWCALSRASGGFYAIRNEMSKGHRKTIYMHAVIAGYSPDHANRNSLDNRRCNLRPCTATQNLANRAVDPRNKSGHKGVSFNRGKWMAQIGSGENYRFLGRFATQEEASRAYDEAAQEKYGEFAFLNHSNLPTLS